MIIRNKNTINTGRYNVGGLNLLEKFCLVVLPLLQHYIIYTILSEVTGLVWWVSIIITISICAVIYTLIFLLSWWIVENEY